MRCAIISIACLAIISAASGDDHTVLNVDVYYESLCSDSMNFIRRQLVPSYEKFKEHLKINFIPFGKAMFQHDEKTGAVSFSCQHGPNECSGNIAQACALSEIEKSFDSQVRQDRSVALVGCVMSTSYPATAVSKCAKDIELSKESIERIDQCSNSNEGKELLVEHGKKTNALDPVITFVPTIVLNGEFSSANQSGALRNFSKLICGHLRDDEKKASCEASS